MHRSTPARSTHGRPPRLQQLSLAPAILALLAIVSVLGGCGFPPPRNLPRTSMLDFFNNAVLEYARVQHDSELRSAFNDQFERFDSIIAAAQGAVVAFFAPPGTAAADDLLYVGDNNSFISTRSVYMTNYRDAIHLSFDGQTWYSTDPDHVDGHDNFPVVTEFETDLRGGENSLLVAADWRMKVNPHLVAGPIRGQRPVQRLASGQVINHTDESLITVDLRRNTLFVPSGTRIRADFVIDGNIISGQTADNQFSMEFLRPVYFYRNGNFATVSFDDRNWGNNIFQFTIRPQTVIRATGPRSIDMQFQFLLQRK